MNYGILLAELQEQEWQLQKRISLDMASVWWERDTFYLQWKKGFINIHSIQVRA